MESGNAGAGTTPPSDDRPGFLERDPAALAAEADLGPNGAAEVTNCQYFYRQLFEVVEDEIWPDQPEGPLATHWRGTGGQQSTHYLINVASVILSLMANASPGVGRTIKNRLRTVLRPPNDHAYEEALVELEVGGMLARKVSPVLLEPLVPEELRSKPNPPMSPDYGVRVPEGIVTVEVTVWHWEAYATWHRMKETIHTALSTRMLRQGVARNVRVELPIGSPQATVEYLSSHDFCNRICDSDSGTIVLTDKAPRPIRAAWSPMLHFDDHASIDWAAVAASGGQSVSVGPNIAHTFGFSINPCINDDDRNTALESLRRSIDRKKRQRDPTLPHFVAIASTFPMIAVSGTEFANTWDVFGPFIEERLWPNERYSWLSGVLQHRPNRVAAPASGLSYWIDYNPNPNASVRAPDLIMRALTGEAEFHAMWQRPRRPQPN